MSLPEDPKITAETVINYWHDDWDWVDRQAEQRVTYGHLYIVTNYTRLQLFTERYL